MKTKEAELNRITISTNILDNRTLLFMTQTEGEIYPRLSVKYIERDELIETKLGQLTPDTTVEYNDLMVAIFKPKKSIFKRRELQTLYDVARHEFVSREFMALDYGSFTLRSGVKKLVRK